MLQARNVPCCFAMLPQNMSLCHYGMQHVASLFDGGLRWAGHVKSMCRVCRQKWQDGCLRHGWLGSSEGEHIPPELRRTRADDKVKFKLKRYTYTSLHKNPYWRGVWEWDGLSSKKVTVRDASRAQSQVDPTDNI